MKSNSILFMCLIVLMALSLFALHDDRDNGKRVRCAPALSDQYERARSLFEPTQRQHKQAFNVDTHIAEDTRMVFGDCGEITRYLVQEKTDGPLRHYTGYVAVSDTSYQYYPCQGEKECEPSPWCPQPIFGPSACGDGMCNGDNGFRGCEE